MGYLEAPLSLNPAEREPKTTIVTRVMLGTVLTSAAELAQTTSDPFGAAVPKVETLLTRWTNSAGKGYRR